MSEATALNAAAMLKPKLQIDQARQWAVVTSAILLCGAVWAQESGLGRLPFDPGEILTFEVSWSIFPAGQLAVAVDKTAGNADDSYKIIMTARSQGFVSLLYKVEDEFTSLFHPKTLCSQRILKKVNEGRRHRETLILYDYVRRLAIVEERDLAAPAASANRTESKIPPCVHDVVTAFYVARGQPLKVGQLFRVPVNDGAKTYDVEVEVQAHERIQTPLGNREAFRLEPKLFGGLYRKGRMLVWFSDDEQRLPLRIRAMLSVGTLTATLRAVSTQAADPPQRDP